MEHRGEESLHLKHNLLVELNKGLVAQVLDFQALEVNNHAHLVDSFAVDDVSAVLELHSPGVLHLLDEKVHEHVALVIHGGHQLLELELACLDEEQRTAFLVRAVEASGQELLDLLELGELEVEDGVDAVFLAPGQVVLQKQRGFLHVKVVGLEEARVEVLIEH